MKFGKQLKQTIAESLPEWQPNFLDYKDLKKRINVDVSIETDFKSLSSSGTSRSVNETASSGEFLAALRKEVDKVNNFYLDMEEDFIIRFQFLANRVDALKLQQSVDRRLVQDLRRKLIDFLRDLVLLERFSEVNYTGFRKILKKHDKKTGLNLHMTYLLTVLETPFFLSTSRRKLQSAAERQLHCLEKFTKFRRTAESSFSNFSMEPTVQYDLQPILKLLENGDESSLARLMRCLDDQNVDKLGINWNATRELQSVTFLLLESTDDHFLGVAVLPKDDAMQFYVREGLVLSKVLRGKCVLRRTASRKGPVRTCTTTGPWPAFRFKIGEFLEWQSQSSENALVLLVTIPGFDGEMDQFTLPSKGGEEVVLSPEKKMVTVFPAM
mmetsp:Transcript_5276/g.15756  ORF Transcript_5276/g.15756 Transcript_5276/m.15756 type:complete len:383 (-) Transcript_5276:53-1201(-)|eukprot:CAMPEP_0198722932 /NCGR_PEP_ID=MMETSP1475-20131203/513_1 /TAXON_ID= ORGANISM="Unidentified sp., Strain CCMP1999" /NCGR_SAMPLE_ID=MMETSP1475 /ASSEMBLY_ACC=CAM_ASM_001111 /LENGTH=382 /DNA_ID=CAMNT_0044483887 /DNA_START=593 /DNA_END=1741 /DNA_ORIENTATION=+